MLLSAGDVLCACDFLSEEMSAVTAFIKVCHGFVCAKGESSVEQIGRSLRAKLKEGHVGCVKSGIKSVIGIVCQSVLCEGH